MMAHNADVVGALSANDRPAPTETRERPPAHAPDELVGRFGRLVVCTGHGSTISGKPSGLAGGGSTLAPGAGRLVSQRQDELGL